LNYFFILRALIFGISGQDGSYLAKLLLDKKFQVFGSTRDRLTINKTNLNKLGIDSKVKLLTTSITDFRSILNTFEEVKPDYVFHLAGQTSVGLSFQLPVEAIESITLSTLMILEAIKYFDRKIKLFLPCSSDCFGDIDPDFPITEKSPHNPKSPYGIAKSSSYWLARYYRDSFAMFVSVGFLSNHESNLRGKQFVFSKLFSEIKSVKNNEKNYIEFGDLNIIRDWGWAPEYIEGIYKIISHTKPDDFVLATGKSYSLYDVVNLTFKLSGLGDARNYIRTINLEKRPNEIKQIFINPKKAKDILNWETKVDLQNMLKKLLNNDLF